MILIEFENSLYVFHQMIMRLMNIIYIV